MACSTITGTVLVTLVETSVSESPGRSSRWMDLRVPAGRSKEKGSAALPGGSWNSRVT